MDDLKKLIADIQRMKARDAFKIYIDYIRFPYFKNLEENTEVSFDFPFTVFVGQNGSGKSSCLHALYGSPLNKTPYDFWFSTAVDPIEYYDDKKRRHSFWYKYKDRLNIGREVVKARIKRGDDPDYWETSRPLVWAGMKKRSDKKRDNPIEMNVLYLDFRSELSAFDKFFYFGNTKNLKSNRKQDFLRGKSASLRKIIDGNKQIINPKHPQNKKMKFFSQKEIEWISFILGKNYKSGKLIEHKLFRNEGVSIIFETDFFTYSEAFAGSGEFAVSVLVYHILNAPEKSLIILDEPEVSLHPGAQKNLKLFLLAQIKKHKHQIVISTHSPALIEDLPNNAIKVFTQRPNGRFHIDHERSPEEAFHFIGQTNPHKKTIFVEDKLAKILVETVINSIDPIYSEIFDILYHNGGVGDEIGRIVGYSEQQEFSKFVIFDGDQKKVDEHVDPNSFTVQQRDDLSFLKKKIKDQTGGDKWKFSADSNSTSGVNEEQLKKAMIDFLKFYKTNIFYFPLNTPEEIIWDDDYLDILYKINDIDKATFEKIKDEWGYALEWS